MSSKIRTRSINPPRRDAKHLTSTAKGVVIEHDSTNGFIHFKLERESNTRCSEDAVIHPRSFLVGGTAIKATLADNLVVKISPV